MCIMWLRLEYYSPCCTTCPCLRWPPVSLFINPCQHHFSVCSKRKTWRNALSSQYNHILFLWAQSPKYIHKYFNDKKYCTFSHLVALFQGVDMFYWWRGSGISDSSPDRCVNTNTIWMEQWTAGMGSFISHRQPDTVILSILFFICNIINGSHLKTHYRELIIKKNRRATALMIIYQQIGMSNHQKLI